MICIVFAEPIYAQDNCASLTVPNRIKACRFYRDADNLPQGSRESQQALDSALCYWPEYAEAWREKSVPYLKRGDFFSWRKYMDKAVQLQPQNFLGLRGWCRFKFLRDYGGALDDLKRFNGLVPFEPGESRDGNYSLYVVMGLCAREMGDMPTAFRYLSLGIDSALSRKGIEWIGLYDYLHRAVTRERIKDYTGALSDLDQQEKKCPDFAESSYYRGLALLGLGQKSLARMALQRAKALYYSEGHRLSDPYCEILDEIYPKDITEALDKAGEQ